MKSYKLQKNPPIFAFKTDACGVWDEPSLFTCDGHFVVADFDESDPDLWEAYERDDYVRELDEAAEVATEDEVAKFYFLVNRYLSGTYHPTEPDLVMDSLLLLNRDPSGTHHPTEPALVVDSLILLRNDWGEGMEDGLDESIRRGLSWDVAFAYGKILDDFTDGRDPFKGDREAYLLWLQAVRRKGLTGWFESGN